MLRTRHCVISFTCIISNFHIIPAKGFYKWGWNQAAEMWSHLPKVVALQWQRKPACRRPCCCGSQGGCIAQCLELFHSCSHVYTGYCGCCLTINVAIPLSGLSSLWSCMRAAKGMVLFKASRYEAFGPWGLDVLGYVAEDLGSWPHHLLTVTSNWDRDMVHQFRGLRHQEV